jgi:hypothetical protein
MPEPSAGRAGVVRKVSVAVAAAVSSIAVLVGCTAEGMGAGLPGESPPVGEVSDAPPPQPYDIFLGEELGLVEFVQMSLRDRCLADAGYPQNLAASTGRSPEDVAIGLQVSARDFGLRGEEEARRLGFGEDSPGSPARIVSFDPSYDANLERCADQAWERLGADAEQAYLAYYDLLNQLLPYRMEAEEEWPEDLPVRMYDCMAGKGFRIDREAFLASPAYTSFGVTLGSGERGTEEEWAPENDAGTVQVGPAIPPRRYTPTPEESALAVAWTQCIRDTGVGQELLDIALQVQQRYVDRFEARITELNAQLEQVARTATELLAEVG